MSPILYTDTLASPEMANNTNFIFKENSLDDVVYDIFNTKDEYGKIDLDKLPGDYYFDNINTITKLIKSDRSYLYGLY